MRCLPRHRERSRGAVRWPRSGAAVGAGGPVQGLVQGTLAALKYMRQRRAGTRVQVGAALAYRGIPLQSAYCAAKFAIRGFTQSLRPELEHAGRRVRVSMVQLPGDTTPQF